MSSQHALIEDMLGVPTGLNRSGTMKALIDCRAMEMMCRKRALADRPHRWEWEARAERWHDVGHQEVARRFQENNAASTTANLRDCPALALPGL